MSRTRRPSSVFVISDLHLGGEPPAMMSRPALLASFVDALPARLGDAPGSTLELVIAGDFVDFLAAAPSAAFTPDPRDACAKLSAVTAQSSPFAPVFDALARHVAAGHRLTVLLGNHDLELALPQVQASLLDRLDASPHEVLFLADGRSHRVGAALIEHGNRYDGANASDFTGLRALASALSRGEAPSGPVEISAGSRIVEKIVTPLKKTYPFIDLLQPQGALVALLLLAFEPGLIGEWDKLAKVLRGPRLERQSPKGLQPGATRHVVGRPSAVFDAELATAFGTAYEDLRRPQEPVGADAWAALLFTPGDDGLAALFAREAPVPQERLWQIRTSLRRLLLDEASDRLDGPAEQYGAAAARLLASGDGIEAVVMGHTHLPRRIPTGAGVYLNTGTWVDRLQVPDAALADDEGKALEAWLRALWKDERAPRPPTYGELRLDEGGRVKVAEVKETER